MSDIIQKWLTDRLGIILDLSSSSFIETVQNGKLISDILYNYGLFSQEQVSEVVAGTMNMYEVFKSYLNKIGVNYTEEIHNDISRGKPSTCIKLLYDIYLSLQSKDKLTFLAIQRRKKILEFKNEKFDVIPISENLDTYVHKSDHPFSRPLNKLNHIIDWHKEKQKTLKQRCKESRENYYAIFTNEILESKSRQLSEKKVTYVNTNMKAENYDIFSNDSIDLNYEQLVQEKVVFEQMPMPTPNLRDANKQIKDIKYKIRKKHKEEKLTVQMHKLLLIELWENIISNQEKKFVTDITEKILKQSIFEQQMVTKILDVRQQKHAIFQNRFIVDKEIQKQKEHEFFEEIFHKEIVKLDADHLYFAEKRRVMELHKRLYLEKQKLKSIRHCNMCYDIMNDLTDLSVYCSEYKQDYGIEVPCRNLKDLATLFINEQPIFNVLEPVEDVIQYDPEDFPEESELIYTQELSRQNLLDAKNFEDYCNLDWPWEVDLKNYFEEQELEFMNLGLNVMGYVVHRVLLTKYPKPISPPPPNLPKVSVSACINGLNDLSILPALEKILAEKEIKLIQIEDGINYCLNIFKTESIIEYVDEPVEEEQPSEPTKKNKKSKKAEKKKPAKKGQKSKSKTKIKKSSEKISTVDKVPSFDNKNVQTPKLFPCEELVLSTAGELGRIANAVLSVGENLNDHLSVAMFVEYLVSLKDIKGWVLINYPVTMQQAALLEENLTSVPLPVIENFDSPESISDFVVLDMKEVPENEPIGDEFEIKRHSKLVPNPIIEEDSYYDSYLTAYINIEQVIEDDNWDYDYFLKEKHQNNVQKFYQDQGSKYNLFYRSMDFETLKHLGKLIIGEYTIPPKTSVEILGASIEYLEANLDVKTGIIMQSMAEKVGTKKEKPKKKEKNTKKAAPAAAANKSDKKSAGKAKKEKGSKKSSEKKSGGKKGKKGGKAISSASIMVIIREDKETQMPEFIPEPEEEYVEPEPDPKPGEIKWKYISSSIPDVYQVALATLWENTEEIYICDFKELFFRKRALLNSVVPYISYVTKHMTKFITRPDNKQKHLHDFQNIYNEIDTDLRDDDELKNEVHCRIYDFRNKLYNICDARMNENENERQRIIEDNWVVKNVCEVANGYITIMQIEIDRYSDSIKLLIEYYTAMITKMPATDAEISKYQLKKIVYEDELAPECSVINLVQFTDKLMKVNEEVLNDSPYHNIINKNCKISIQFVEDTYNICQQVINKLAAIFNPKENKKNSKSKQRTDTSSVKSKKDPKKLPTFLIPEPDVIEAATNLIDEFTYALEGERNRVKLRLHVINLVVTKDLNDVLTSTTNMFHTIYDDIKRRYIRELNSIETACSILSRAVEAESQIQPQLILDGDLFYVQTNVLLFNDPLPDAEPPLEEIHPKYIFSINQLIELCTVLRDIAPNGYLPERTFVFLLQDMVVHNAEDGKLPLVPEYWSKLTPKDVSSLSFQFFGNSEFIDWRDFIIYNCVVSFPTHDELLKVRRLFRECDPDSTEYIYEQQYITIKFWFEKDEKTDPQEILRLNLIKKLLWNCYKVDNDRINYTALLLSFCKDENPTHGLAKGISLSLGKLVCLNCELGDAFIENELSIRRRIVEEALLKKLDEEDTIRMTQDIIGELADTSVHLCDSTYLLDYQDSAEVLPDTDLQDSVKDLSETRSLDMPETSEPIETIEPIEPIETIEPIEVLVEASDEIDEPSIHSADSIITEERFSNVEIGFEPSTFGSFAYILPYEVLITIITAAMPWYANMQNFGEESIRQKIENIYNKLKNADLDNAVFAHTFLNNDELVDIFKTNFKFTIKCPKLILSNLLEKWN